MRQPKYKLGTVFNTRDRYPLKCTVIDIHRTFNSSNELVKLRYVTVHEMLGQKVTDYDVPETAIALGTVLYEPE